MTTPGIHPAQATMKSVENRLMHRLNGHQFPQPDPFGSLLAWRWNPAHLVKSQDVTSLAWR
jgi:hypothetical protein